jgi:large subunit ribosomal protein L33
MREKVRLTSSAGTGYCYYTTKNKQKTTDKIQKKKYDPVVRRHVLFVEGKLPSHSKK